MMQARKTGKSEEYVSEALDHLINLSMKRITVRPVPEYYEEEEALKRSHAEAIVVGYTEQLGRERTVEIVNNTPDSHNIEEMILWEIELREQQEVDQPFEGRFTTKGCVSLNKDRFKSPSDSSQAEGSSL
jgi:hypothetical protein